MKKCAVLKKREGLMIVAETESAVREFHEVAAKRLGQQAAFASRFTGLSLEYCSKMVLHRMARRMGA